MPFAGRKYDHHTCSKIEPGPLPHIGGPIIMGEPTVWIGGEPAARVGDPVFCCGPPDKIAAGSATVSIGKGKKGAARVNDRTEHGGKIVAGCPTVMIGDVVRGAKVRGGGAPLVEPCAPLGGRVEPDPTM